MAIRASDNLVSVLALMFLISSSLATSNYQPTEYTSENGFLNVTISIGWLWSLNETRYAPAYNGAPVGPTLRLKAGDTLSVTLVNNLEPVSERDRELKTYVKDPSNNRTNVTIIDNRLSEIGEYHAPKFGYWGHNFMNLHWHGARFDFTVEDIGFALDGGSQQRTYVYKVDEDQPPGLAWYHNHFHGTTSYSYLSGLYGAVIIDAGEDDLSDISQGFNATETLIFFAESRVNANTSIPVDFVPIAGDFAWEHVTNGQLGSEAVYTYHAGETAYFRIISATVEANVEFSIDNHTMLPLAYDGYPIPTVLAETEVLTIDSGSRIEFLVRFDTPGTYKFRRLPWNYGVQGTTACNAIHGIDNDICVSWDDERLTATIIVTEGEDDGTSSDSTDFSKVEVPSYHPSLTRMAAQPPVRERFVILSEATSFPLFQIPYTGPFRTGRAFGMNNRFFDVHESSGDIEAGTCETWTVISNAPNVGHPFHIHSVPFLVTHIGGRAVETPFWRDTMALNSLDVKIHVCFPDSPGLLLVHCHMATHLDTGMAALYSIVPATTQSPSWSPVTASPVTPAPTPAPITPAPTLAPVASTPSPITPAPTPVPVTPPTPFPVTLPTPFPVTPPTPFPVTPPTPVPVVASSSPTTMAPVVMTPPPTGYVVVHAPTILTHSPTDSGKMMGMMKTKKHSKGTRSSRGRTEEEELLW